MWITIVSILLIQSTVLASECYWHKYPICGTFMKCGRDHYLKTGLTPNCFLTPSKYCCPRGPYDDIILCEGEGYQGACIVHSIKRHTCTNLRILPNSVKTLGSCFRLYEDIDCGGYSIAVYSEKHQNLVDLKFNSKAKSVSDCFAANYIADKCPNSNFTDERCRWYVKPLALGPTWVNIDRNATAPVRFYELGSNRRTQVVQAFLYPDILKSNLHDDNELNYIIPISLGGSTQDPRNQIIRSQLIDRDYWMKSMRKIISAVIKYQQILLTVNVVYEDDETEKPQRIIYRTLNMESGDFVNIISIPNP